MILNKIIKKKKIKKNGKSCLNRPDREYEINFLFRGFTIVGNTFRENLYIVKGYVDRKCCYGALETTIQRLVGTY